MLSGVRNLFRPPVIEDSEKAAQARSIYIILVSTLALTILFLIYALFFPPAGQIIVALGAIAIELGLLFLIRSKRTQLASAILTSMLWIAILAEVALYGGIRDTGFGAFAAIIIISGLTMGPRGSVIFTALTLLAGAGLALAENQGLLPKYALVPISTVLLSHSIDLIAVVLLLNLAIRSLATVARKALNEEKSEKEINAKLAASQIDLQQRSSALEQRNATLQTIASVSQITSRVSNEDGLLEQTGQMLMEKIKLDYVGIFILDQVQEYAILQFSKDREGKLQEAPGYKLTVVRSESAGLLIGAGPLRIKIGNWNYYLDPPSRLPNMQTSLLFPISSSDQFYGVLNIQTESGDLEKIDQPTMQMLAGQIGLSIANIRLLNALQNRMQEVSLLAGKNVENAWERMATGKNIGYSYDRLQVLPANEMFAADITDQLRAGKSASFIYGENPRRARLVAPILLRDAIIGVIGYDSDDTEHKWQNDEVALLETIASRVSLALENTRLVEEAQQRAEHERLVGQITNRMRETLDIDTILKTAVKEMRQSFELQEAEVRLQLLDENQPAEVNNE